MSVKKKCGHKKTWSKKLVNTNIWSKKYLKTNLIEKFFREKSKLCDGGEGVILSRVQL